MIGEVVQPVGVVQVGAEVPGHRRLAAGIVSWEVVFGALDVRAGGQVPHILAAQGVPVILRVAYEEAPALTETARIYRYLPENPEKLPSANHFRTYYLVTVGRILGQYAKLQDAGLRIFFSDICHKFQHFSED